MLSSVITLVSHPTWVRGLKYGAIPCYLEESTVAPYMGAWIEIPSNTVILSRLSSRTLHGCMD